MTNDELITQLEGALVNSEGGDFQIRASFVREIIDALRLSEPAAIELLREWRATELDAQDEEFAPWLDSFTARVDAILRGEPAALPEDVVTEPHPKTCPNCGAFGIIDGPLERECDTLRRWYDAACIAAGHSEANSAPLYLTITALRAKLARAELEETRLGADIEQLCKEADEHDAKLEAAERRQHTSDLNYDALENRAEAAEQRAIDLELERGRDEWKEIAENRLEDKERAKCHAQRLEQRNAELEKQLAESKANEVSAWHAQAGEQALREQAERNEAAIRELMNWHNLGGWTDAEAAMKRALSAEQRNAELERRIEQWECESHPWSYGEDGDPVTDPVAVRDRIDTLIRRNAAVTADVERLDRLQALTGGYGIGWLLRPSTSGRGWRLHESAQDGALPTVREAIDALDLAALT